MKGWRTSTLHEPLEHLHRPAADAAHRVGDRATFCEPAPDHHVGAAVDAVEQRLHRQRIVLAVGVELDRPLVAVPHRVREAGAQRAPDPDVERQDRDVHAGGGRQLGGAVARAVGHHEHVVVGRLLGELLEHRRQRLLLVVRRDDDERAPAHVAGHDDAFAGARRHSDDSGLSFSRRNGFSTR